MQAFKSYTNLCNNFFHPFLGQVQVPRGTDHLLQHVHQAVPGKLVQGRRPEEAGSILVLDDLGAICEGQEAEARVQRWREKPQIFGVQTTPGFITTRDHIFAAKVSEKLGRFAFFHAKFT